MMKIADVSVSATTPVRAALMTRAFRYAPPQKFTLRSGILVWGVCMALLAADAWMAAADARRARNAVNGALIGAGIGALVDGREGARTGAVVGAITGAVRRP
jgi:hypothetical protein